MVPDSGQLNKPGLLAVASHPARSALAQLGLTGIGVITAALAARICPVKSSTHFTSIMIRRIQIVRI
jgi:hypothetical protein